MGDLPPSALLQGTFSELAQGLFKLKGEYISYKDQSYMVTAVDDTDYETIVMRTGRQVGKTTSQSIRAVISCLQLEHFHVLYVSPSFKQTKRFSRKALDPICKDSEFVTTQFMDPSLTWSIETKQFSNNSDITLHYAFHTADRSRGESMDFLEIDELQNILPENIPVLEQTLVHSKPRSHQLALAHFYKKKLYTGTPLTMDGTLEHYWAQSTQMMWEVPCYACGGWSQLTEKSIGKHGTVCTNNATGTGGSRHQCARPIDPRQGVWHAMNPGADIMGVHISQLMAPRVEWGPHGWIRWEKDILMPFEGRSPGWDKLRVYNEILGFPCESATRAITEADMMACVDEKWSLVQAPTAHTNSLRLFAGIDWGSTRSRTVLTIGGKGADGRFGPVFIRRWEGDEENDPTVLIDEILNICKAFNVIAIACDVGYGFGLNSQLIQTGAYDMSNVFPIRYVGWASPRLARIGKRRWEYSGNRSTLMGELFTFMKRKRIRLPPWKQWAPFKSDFLSVFVELSGRADKREMRYSHGVGLKNADDGVHSFLYSMAAEELANVGCPTIDDTFYN